MLGDLLRKLTGQRQVTPQQNQPAPIQRPVNLSAIEESVNRGGLRPQMPQQGNIPQVAPAKPFNYSDIEDGVRNGGLQPLTPYNGLRPMNAPQQGDFANDLRRRLGL